MKALIIITRNPHHGFLVTLHTERLRNEIKKLIFKRKLSHAMTAALSKGRFEREVASHEVHGVKASLILSEDGANWNLLK